MATTSWVQCSSAPLFLHSYVPLGSASLWIIAHLIGLLICSDLHYSIFDRRSTTPESPPNTIPTSPAVRPRAVCGGIPERVSNFPIELLISITPYEEYIPHRTAHGGVPVSCGWTGGGGHRPAEMDPLTVSPCANLPPSSLPSSPPGKSGRLAAVYPQGSKRYPTDTGFSAAVTERRPCYFKNTGDVDLKTIQRMVIVGSLVTGLIQCREITSRQLRLLTPVPKVHLYDLLKLETPLL